MRSSTVRLSLAGVALLLLGSRGHQAAGTDPFRIPVVLDAPEPRFEALGDGSIARLDGFGESSRTDEPAVPIKILLVAIPEGMTPALEIGRSDVRPIGDYDAAPVPRLRVRDRAAADPERDATPEFRRDPAVYGRHAWFPQSPVRLGRIGYLREQRFVEVIYTPLLVDPAGRRARFYSHVEAQVRLDGAVAEDTGDAAGRGGAGRGAALESAPGSFVPDPHFESAYAASLLNYEQGKRFRVRRRGPAAAQAPVSGAVAAEGAAAEAAPLPAANAGPRYKLSVTQSGVYRLTQSYLQAQAPDLLATDPRTWAVLVDGVEIPIAIRDAAGGSGEADGVFGASDTLDFYGRGKTAPPTVLNYDFPQPLTDVFQQNDFTSTQVYWLVATGVQGGHDRIPTVGGAPVSGFTQATDFQASAVWEENNIYFPLLDNDPFFSFPGLLAQSSDQQRNLSLALPGIAPGAWSATVTGRLRGGSDLTADNDHRTRLWVNSDTVNVSDAVWDGEVIQTQSFNVPAASLSNPVTLHALAVTQAGISVDRQYLDTLTVTYRRAFTASGETLEFTVPNQDGRYPISGLSATAPVVYEVGRPLAANGEADAVQITGAAPGGAPTTQWTFEVAHDASPGAPATRTFVVAGPGGVRLPDSAVAAAAPLLAVPGQSAGMIVIAARSAVDASPGGALDLLLQHRLQAQGLTSKVVFIDQVYDEFSGGRRDANAVKSFLAYAYANWRGPLGQDPPPAFVLLVGDATPDYKNNLQRADWVDQVPTPMMLIESSIIGYYSSDNWLAAVNGADQVPDLHLGRISTRTPAASGAVFDKIRHFETTPPAGLWKGRAVMSASEGKVAGESDQFETIGNSLMSEYFSTPPMSAAQPPLYYDNPPWNATDNAGFNTALRNALNAGEGVLTYVGHGGFDVWGLDSFWSTADAMALTNGSMLPFMVNMNCLSGGFHYLAASGSMAEGFVNNPNGGAVAAFAPSGLSNAFIGSVVSDSLFASLLGPGRERRLGPATLQARLALWGQGSIVDMQSYTFLGDPASTLATPAPPPPTGLGATPGNGFVDLAWTAPVQPAASTRIYRAAISPSGNYTAVTCTSTGTTSCRDQTVVNGTRYYYFAVSADAEGFEGAVSNFNADCNAGPGCVTALPINLTPPAAPTGLVLRDTGAGDRLGVSWNANPEPDIKRYTLRYGTVSGSYTGSLSVNAPATSTVLTGLTTGIRTYAVLIATNTSGVDGAPTPETSEVPHVFEGISPPRAISDLALNRSGNDVVLTWSRPTVDIYGRPTSVVAYRVYRGSTPNFQVAPGSLLATLNDGAVTTFTHTGGINLAGNSYYLVTAVDAAGLVSGAGRELPNGTGDLAVSFTAPSTAHLTWSPVTTDLTGLPTILDHYQVHLTATPVGRGSLGPSTLFLDNVTTTSIDISVTGPRAFISVLAVDNRGNLSPF
ncbi:MAG TPA: C25 family cysteine peptidase [Candidatus Polarisedimenticolia bacterium]|nr:C25 family cysteine peptidase [Candidatus Polarisedimenticolia bacterium]